MVRARPTTSATVSPLARSAITKPAIWEGVAAPDMISRIAQADSSEVRCSPDRRADSREGQVVRESMGTYLALSRVAERRRMRSATVSASTIGSSGCGTTASALDHSASQRSSRLAMIRQMGGQS